MNVFRLRTIAFTVGFCLLLGAGAGSAAPEKIPPDKVVHPILGPVMEPQIIPGTRKEPVYPERWRKLHLGARVILQGVIEESGSVGECDALKTLFRVETDCGKAPGEWVGMEAGSSLAPPEAERDFEAAALDAVKEWKFRPGTMNGSPVAVFYTLIVDFSLCPKKTVPQQPPDR